MQTLELPIVIPTVDRATEYTVRYVDTLLPIAKEDPPMIVVMRATATQENIDAVLSRLAEHQLRGSLVRGEERTIIGVVGAAIPPKLREELELFDVVMEAVRITRPYKLAAREFPHGGEAGLDLGQHVGVQHAREVGAQRAVGGVLIAQLGRRLDERHELN